LKKTGELFAPKDGTIGKRRSEKPKKKKQRGRAGGIGRTKGSTGQNVGKKKKGRLMSTEKKNKPADQEKGKKTTGFTGGGTTPGERKNPRVERSTGQEGERKPIGGGGAEGGKTRKEQPGGKLKVRKMPGGREDQGKEKGRA